MTTEPNPLAVKSGDLFPNIRSVLENPIPKEHPENFMDRIAKRKHGNIPGWEPYRYEVVGSDESIMITGSQCSIVNGKKKWKPAGKEIEIITQAEIDAEKQAYENETGNCSECFGAKEVVWSVSVTEGRKYRECPICKGTGKAKA